MVSLSPLQVFGTGMIGIGFVLLIVGTATTHWAEDKVGPGTMGLYKVCGKDICLSILHPTSKMRVYQAFAILSIFAAAGGGGVACVVQVAKLMGEAIPYPKLVNIFAFMLTIGALGCMIVTVTVFVDAQEPIIKAGTDYGYSFKLHIAGGVIAFLGGLVFLLGSLTGSGNRAAAL